MDIKLTKKFTGASIMPYELESKSYINIIYSIGLGLLPLLSLLDYNFQGITVERMLLIIFALVAVFRLCACYSLKIAKKPFIPIFIYCSIITFNIFFYESCGVFGLASLWLILAVDLAISPGIMMDFVAFKKTVSFVAIVCSIIIIIQYLLYYGTGVYWNPIPKSLYRQDVILAYSNFLSSGLEGNLLRPSAIFLEPSHMAEYSILALVLQLFDENENYKKSILITIGIFLCTSGLGIIASIIAWGYKIFFDSQMSKNKKVTVVFGIMAVISIAYFVLENIGVASLLLSKFRIGSDNSGFTSRFGDVQISFQGWQFKRYLVGEGFDSSSKYWLPGYFSIIRQIGIVGLVAFLAVLGAIFKVSDKTGKCLVLVYMWLLLVAEVSTMTYMIFYLSAACLLHLSSLYQDIKRTRNYEPL